MAVSAEVSVVRAMAASGVRSSMKRPTNSAAMCWASAALPPLPMIKSLLAERSAGPARCW
jgi:hypothetical protein